MANPYDVNVIFAELEQELVMSFKRNMSKHVDTSDMWQAMKMKDLEQYRREVAKEIASATGRAKKLSKIVLRDDFLKGADKVDAFMKQFKLDIKPTTEHEFFRANRRKLNTMLESVYTDLDIASHAIYRQMDDVYRQTMFKAEIAKNAGVFTPEQAVDVATKDFLEKGINCIKYSNGAMVNIASYAEMVVRTSSKRAMMVGEGARNQEWGVTTIKITQHGSTCDLCSPWQGRVLIDDVYSGGKPSDGPYPLLSQAMEAGLFHPNCRHGSTTFFEGISEESEPYNQREVEEKYEKEQQQRYNERKIREWKRKANGSFDEGNKRKAEEKVKYWQARQRELLDENDWLRRRYDREGIKGIGLEKKLPKVETPKVEIPKVEPAKPEYIYHATRPESLAGIAEKGLKPNSGHVGEGIYFADSAEDALEWTKWTSTEGTKVLRVNKSLLKKENLERWAAEESGYNLSETVYSGGTIPLEALELKVGSEYVPLALHINKRFRSYYPFLSAKTIKKIEKIVSKL